MDIEIVFHFGALLQDGRFGSRQVEQGGYAQESIAGPFGGGHLATPQRTEEGD
jgi:hypothetical protein